MFKLREIQEQKSTELKKVVRKHRIGILAGEVRSGKTLTVLATAEKLRKKHVLFLTKKRAMSSIQSDYELAGFTFKLTLIKLKVTLVKLKSTSKSYFSKLTQLCLLVQTRKKKYVHSVNSDLSVSSTFWAVKQADRIITYLADRKAGQAVASAPPGALAVRTPRHLRRQPKAAYGRKAPETNGRPHSSETLRS